jgi:hypothetical protein
MFHLLLSMVLCCLLQDGLLFLLPHLPRRIILGVAWRGPTPVLVVSTQVGVIIKEVLSMVIMIICQEHCPIYAFLFVFPSLSYSNPHSFVVTITILFILIFNSLTVCLHIQYSAR